MPAVDAETAADAAEAMINVDKGTEGAVKDGTTLRPLLFAKQSPPSKRAIYTRANLSDASATQSRFFDDDYSDILRRTAHQVPEGQVPIHEDAIARELARAHGFARTGIKTKQRKMELLVNVTTSVERSKMQSPRLLHRCAVTPERKWGCSGQR